jgi:hypothetical protein
MPIYFEQEADTGRAIWRSEDGIAEAVLCSVSLLAYESEPKVCELFGALVNAVADYFRRRHAAASPAPVSRLAGLPCETCETSQGIEIRHRVAQVASVSELGLLPSGLPLNCCRVRTVAVMSGQPDQPRAGSSRF